MAITAQNIIGNIPPGERLSFAQLLLDAAYPAGGYPLTPALFGLTAFAAKPPSLNSLIPPMILAGNGQAGFGFEMDVDQVTGNLRVYYPTGGSIAAPAAPADPVGNAGATAVTSSAATLPIVPGRGKELPAGANLTGFTVILLAIGH